MSIKYRDIEVELSRCLCDKPEVRILESPFDRPRERFKPPFELGGLNDRLDRLDELMLETGQSADRKQLAEDIGQEIFKAVFPGKIGITFGKSMAALDATRADGKNDGLRIRFSFGEFLSASRSSTSKAQQDAVLYQSKVIGLPFELICDPETKLFPNRAPQTPVVRYLDLSRHIAPLATPPPVKVLAVFSSPKDMPSIDLERQKKTLVSVAGNPEVLKIFLLKSANLSALNRELDRHKEAGEPFHVLHYLGHGGFGSDGEGVLYFENGERNRHPISGRELAMHLSGYSELRLAMLATCKGARMGREEGQHPFSGAASALIAGGFPAAVAMQFPISVDAATAFISAFYRKVAAGKTVEEAVTDGRREIAASEPGSFEWATPVLFLRTRDGKILDLQESKKKAGPDVQPAGRTRVRVGTVQAEKKATIIGRQGTGDRPAGDVEVNVEKVGGESVEVIGADEAGNR